MDGLPLGGLDCVPLGLASQCSSLLSRLPVLPLPLPPRPTKKLAPSRQRAAAPDTRTPSSAALISACVAVSSAAAVQTVSTTATAFTATSGIVAGTTT